MAPNPSYSTDYRNEGHSIRYHANSFEVTFYDKLKDLQKARLSEKRAVEQDNAGQINLFAQTGTFPKQLEILRMEVRLGSRARIVKLLKQLDIQVEPTFGALFDQSIAKVVLLHFWDNVRRQLPLASQVKHQRPEDVFALLAVAAKGKTKPSKLLQLLGSTMLLGSVGFRGTAALVCRHSTPRSWQRYKRELKTLPALDLGAFNALALVDKSLTSFKPLRLASFRVSDPPCNFTSLQVEGKSTLAAARDQSKSPRRPRGSRFLADRSRNFRKHK